VTRKSINGEWESYRTQVLPKDAPPIQIMECRRAFYAGSEAFFRCVFDVSGDDVSEDAGAEYLETLNQELQAFGRDVGAGKA
jgi:hypothetical protein